MAGESAGQCGPCVFGLASIADDLFELCGQGSPAKALQRLQFRLGDVGGRGAYHHPDGVVRLVRGALGAFATDVDRYIRSGPCRGVRAPTVMPLPRTTAATRPGRWLAVR